MGQGIVWDFIGVVFFPLRMAIVKILSKLLLFPIVQINPVLESLSLLSFFKINPDTDLIANGAYVNKLASFLFCWDLAILMPGFVYP